MKDVVGYARTEGMSKGSEDNGAHDRGDKDGDRDMRRRL